MRNACTTLCFDGQNLAWRAAHSAQGAKGANLGVGDVPTYVLYGVMRSVVSLIKMFEPTSVVLGWDNGRAAWRTALVPAYKAHRNGPRDAAEAQLRAEVHAQIDVLRAELPALGVCSIDAPYTEADDICAAAAAVLAPPVVLVSTDDDMMQLVRGTDVRVWHPHRETLLSAAGLEATMGFPVALYPAYRALVGDSSDNLAGAVGIGPKTAATLVHAVAQQATSARHALELIRADGACPAIRRGTVDWDAVLATLEVMDLTHDRTGARHAVVRAVGDWRPFSRAAFYALVGRYHLTSMLSDGAGGLLAGLRAPEAAGPRRTPVVWSGTRGAA